MVKILANGEMVPDDDPRVRGSNARPRQPQHGGIPPMRDSQQFQGGVQQVSIFTAANQRLLAYGIPRWNIGETVIEPIVSVGLVAALLLFGVQGLFFGIILFIISQWSTNGTPDFVSRFLGNPNNQQPGSTGRGHGTGRTNTGSSGGHRLGRD